MPTLSSPARALLGHLIGREEPRGLVRAGADESSIPGLGPGGLATAMAELTDAGLISCHRSGSGAHEIWSMVVVAPEGYRILEQWPPAGDESTVGDWDRGHWASRCLPLMERLAGARRRSERRLAGTSPRTTADEAGDLFTATALVEAGYLTGSPLPHLGWADLGLTDAGRRSLEAHLARRVNSAD